MSISATASVPSLAPKHCLNASSTFKTSAAAASNNVGRVLFPAAALVVVVVVLNASGRGPLVPSFLLSVSGAMTVTSF